MPDRSASATRILLGLTIGILVGVGGFLLIPILLDDPDPLLRWGVLFWYSTLGAMIGMLHEVMVFENRSLPRWAAGTAIGAWMNLVVTFFAHTEMRMFMEAVVGEDSGFTSPFWFVVEGGAVGFVIGLVIDRFAGEGRTTGGD